MKRKIVWLVVSSLMVLSLLAASCAPAVEEAAPAAPAEGAAPAEEVAPVVEEKPAAPSAEMVKLTLTKLDGTKIEKLVEKPRYGGTLRFYATTPPIGFDSTIVSATRSATVRWTGEDLMTGDWTRSGAGTGEATFWGSLYYPPAFYVGALAESWEVPDSQTIIYHLRKGVKFQNKTPYGSWSGREMTSDDVAFSINRDYSTVSSWAYTDTWPQFHPVSVNATDKYTVVVKSQPGSHILKVHEGLALGISITPRDFIEKFKNQSDWRNEMGTGPFLLVDVVPASCYTLIRNPDYWRKDPLFPENQLPYVDKIEYYVIPDKSTYIAALRTGKVDRGDVATYEDLEGLRKGRPDILWAPKNSTSGYPLYLNMQDKALPYQDIRVRKALSMAIDREAIVKDYFRGYADILAFPVIPMKEWIVNGLYTPLNEQPAHIQEILSYNPEKAKQLLAEAGYPKGFKTSVDVVTGVLVDYVTIIKEQFAAIGVDVEIQVREYTLFNSIAFGGLSKGMMLGNPAGASNPYAFLSSVGKAQGNSGRIDDPILNNLAIEVGNLAYDEPAMTKLYKEKALPYLLEQVYHVVVPFYYSFPVWQPWLKNNDGAPANIGALQYACWPIYVWLDQELKKAMGY